MTNKVTTRWIENNAITAAKIQLGNNAPLKGRNAANTADVNILKVSGDNNVYASSFIRTPSTLPSQSYETANVLYVNNRVASSIAATKIQDLANVTISSPVLNQVLKYSGAEWINATSPAGATELNGLSDVVISAPVINQVIKYNGTNWINSTDVGKNELAKLTDVVLSNKQVGQVIKYNGTSWVNSTDAGTAVRQVEYVVITSVTAAARAITLGHTPISASDVELDVIGGVPQEYGVDFAISGNQLIWDSASAKVSVGMESDVISGDKFRITYES